MTQFNKNLYLILLTIITRPISSEWSPGDCPADCVCHQTWVGQLEAALNTLDCKDRDIVALDSVPVDTEALALRGNQLHVEALNRHNLSNILYIDLSNNQLKLHQVEALQAFFAQLQALRALDLSYNYLETLQTSLFKELKSLEFLSLSGNTIVYIERNTFQALTKLRVLKLDNNHLRKIDENWFSNVSLSLRDLDLTSNRIESIQGGELMLLTGLERLRVSRNNISYIHSAAFVNLNILELHLNKNLLRSMPNETLLPLRNLAILKMDDNPIVSLDKNSLVNQLNLKQLSLSYMPHLQVIHKSAFKNLPKLLKVDLFENTRLEYVHPESFVNCPEMRILHLHTCSLRGLDEALHNNLPSLQELSLYNNDIECNCLAKWLRNTTVHLIDGDKIVCAGPHAVRMATLYELTDQQIELECSPLVVLQSSTSVSIDFGADVNLECQALGSSTLHWNKPTYEMWNENATQNGGRLQLPSVQHNDEGIYTCVATSATGESDSASVYVQVVHALITLTTLTVSKSFMVLQWDDTQGSTLLTYASGEGVTKDVNIPAGIRRHTIENLKPDTGYVICLLYHNKLEQSCITVHMLPTSRADAISTSNSQSDSSDNAANSAAHSVMIAIAISSVFIISMFICVTMLVYKRYHRNKRSKAVYLRQKNDSIAAAETCAHITMEQCYNPTTIPLFENELM